MGTINFDVFQQCLPSVSRTNLEKYIEPIINTCEEFTIDTPERLAAFLAQTCYESNNFNSIVENLNYSANGLVKVFPKYFPTIEKAMVYERQPEKIANYVYANRMGNGSEHTGDGWRYKGRGLIQLTGKTNYMNCGNSLGVALIDMPNYLESPIGAARSAGWYWNLRNLNALADVRNFNEITKKINGGYHGLSERTALYDNALNVLERV